ncbi:hypothetical protein BCR32DRAFT_295000 [Anaeromyces robustus]|uniref:TLC domain-containing protein n=1 Tax=Anaeromyces robustus TaxID=1754192 RepID=A0A1Y1WYK6_9FUNG|nr:hypothetical protein BCR32DRAFT_295000 [Anaeromyces robustus]|eukprot:ORX78512.1 hypothetical protein BCR32DRAFT_295000 [Anaeromyces robustus]
MFNLNSIQIIVDDYIDILLNRFLEESFKEGFIIPKIKDYYVNILSFFLFFSILYLSLDIIFTKIWKNKYYLKLPEIKRKDWNSKIVAFIHAIIISTFCISLIYKYGFPWNKTEKDYNDREIDLYYKAISISTGYFMWDIIYCLSDVKRSGMSFVIHGVCAFLIYVFTFKHHVLGHYAILFLNYEISTIFLNIYWILDKLDLTGSILQLVNALLLVVTFFSVRIVSGNITICKLLYDIFFARKLTSVYLSLYFFINIVPMQILNFIWFYKMIRSILRHFDSPGKPTKKEKPKTKKSVKKNN